MQPTRNASPLVPHIYPGRAPNPSNDCLTLPSVHLGQTGARFCSLAGRTRFSTVPIGRNQVRVMNQ